MQGHPASESDRLADALRTGPIRNVTRQAAGGLGLLSSLTRLHMQYERPDDGGPSTVILKEQGTDPGLRQLCRQLQMVEREVGIYRWLSTTDIHVSPTCYDAQSAESSDQYAILLEDLGMSSLPTQAAGCDPETARDVLTLLAELHAETWDSKRLAALAICPELGRPVFAFLPEQYREAWPRFFDRYRRVLPEGALDVAAALSVTMADELHAWSAHHARSVIHGDARLDNVLQAHDGALKLIDWQMAAIGPPAFDLAHFICGSMTIEARRLHLDALLDHYLRELRGRGVVDYARRDLDVDFRNALTMVLPLNVIFGAGPSAGPVADGMRLEVLHRYFSAIDDLHS